MVATRLPWVYALVAGTETGLQTAQVFTTALISAC
jgi:hypothetical protein